MCQLVKTQPSRMQNAACKRPASGGPRTDVLVARDYALLPEAVRTHLNI